MEIKIADELNGTGEPLAVRNEEVSSALFLEVLDSGGECLRTIRFSISNGSKVGERHGVIRDNYRLKVPQCVQDAIASYKADNDWMAHFLEECCEIDPTYTAKSGEFYNEYRTYCAQVGEYIRSTTDFYTAIELAGFEKKRTKTGVIVRGIRLKSDFLKS